MTDELREILLDVKTYLGYQRSMGNHYLPRKEQPKMNKEQPAKKAVHGKDEALKRVMKELDGCKRCELSRERNTIVFGEGDPNADLMFIGEGPGFDEDRQGRPFVGRAGQLLTKIIEAMGLTRDDVYIANVVKCRPPGNRNPEPLEIAACSPFLLKQIEIIEPKLIVALGTFAAQTLIGTDAKISGLRGKIFDFKGIKLIPTYHPAFLLRNPNMKRPVWEDMQKVMAELGLPPRHLQKD